MVPFFKEPYSSVSLGNYQGDSYKTTHSNVIEAYLAQFQDLKNSPEYYYWETKEGDKYLGISPLSQRETQKLLNAFEEDYFNLSQSFAFFKKTFEGLEATPFLFQYALCTKEDETFLTVLKRPGLEEISLESNFKEGNFSLGLTKSNEVPNRVEWDNRLKKALKKIQAKEISKVVLKRNITYALSKDKLPCLALFKELSRQATNTYKVIFPEPNKESIFMSFSPESLFSWSSLDESIHLEAIAGTRPRGKDEQEDKELESELVNDAKELNEHQAVISQITEVTHSLGKVIKGDLEVLKLKGVQHLRTPLKLQTERRLNFEEVLTLTNTLHPTPAVCGTPTKKAKDLIREIEGERGHYAGILGLYSKEKFEGAVLIRSLNYYQDRSMIEAHGGAGIVLGSTPENEWKETATKVNSFVGQFIENEERTPRRQQTSAENSHELR